MNWFNIFCCAKTKLKRVRFKKSFLKIGEGSGFGRMGYGDKCMIGDRKRISIGNHTWFGQGTTILVLPAYQFADGKQGLDSMLTIGNNVSSTENCRITCAGNIQIDDDVLMAPDVFITDHNHGMDPTKQGGYSPQPLIVKDVHICEGVWLGQRVCVLPGVTIGAHSIIGANSVVTPDIPAYSIAVGSPARVVKTWDKEKNTWMRL